MAADTNTEKADVPIVVADTKPPVVDAGPDGKADVGVVLDTSALDGTARLDGGAADLADTAAIPEPGMDAGTSAPEPSPDAAVAKEDAAVKEDAAAPIGNKDAAVTTEDKPALLGGGFCAISSSRTSSSGAFALLGLAALALLRRRRDGRR
jgi:MYXO-CTERM domain-containing protein